MRRLALAIALLLVASSLSAFDVKRKEALLDAKALAFPALNPQFDAARVQQYLASGVWSSWNAAHGGKWTAQYDTLTGHARRAWGGAVPWITAGASDAQLEQVARSFIDANNGVLGVANARLRFVPEAASPTRDGRVRYAAFDYVIDGVPVESGRLIFAVNNGNMIYWHSANIADVPAVTSPAISVAQALGSALSYAGVAQSQATVVREPTLKLLPRNGLVGSLLGYQLIYETAFRLSGGRATWGVWVDALSGQVVAFGDTNRYAECPPRNASSGKVTGGIRPAQFTDAEVVRSFPFVAVEGDAPVTTTRNGSFDFAGGTLSTGLNGTFFDTNCSDCIKSESDPQSGFQPFVSSSDGKLALGTGGRDVVSGPGIPTVSYGNGTSTPADRTAFFHTNVARGIATKWLDFPWLQTKVTVNVNINDVCNAFWDGTALNFFKSGQFASSSGLLDCKNTGEIRDVMQHEWGHGLDENDGDEPGYALGIGDFATGEAAADHIALFVDHDSCIGQSFYNRFSGPFLADPDAATIATCDGVRNIDELRATRGNLSATNVTQKCPGPPIVTGNPLQALYVGPLFREGHCEGEIWGQTDYHLAQTLITGRSYGTATLDANKQHTTYAGDPLPNAADGSPNPGMDRDAAWNLLERLYFESRPLVASYAPSRYQAQGGSAYDGLLVVDDEGDGLFNGTPHAAYINDAYVHHGIEEWGVPGGVPSGVDAKDCDAPASPGVTLAQGIDGATGLPAVTVSWTSVAGAAAYSVLRNERRNDVFLELARVTSGNSFVDAGVDNGVTYNYRVQAISGSACYAASGGSVKSISVNLPIAAAGSVGITDTPGGNGDHALDPGEKAQLFLVVKNEGIASLTNVTATLVSLTPGVTVTKAGPRSYGSIAPGASAGPNQSFAIELDPSGALCGLDAALILSVSSDQGCYSLPVSLPVGDAGSCAVYKNAYAQATSMAITSDRVALTCGDGDLVPDPGETVRIVVDVNNAGAKTANNVAVKLTSNKTYFTPATTTVSLGTLAPLGAESKQAVFEVAVARTAPFADVATFTVTVTSSGSTLPATRTLTTVVNRDKVLRTLGYDFESGTQGWTSSDPANGWERTSLAVTTGNLTNLWHARYGPERCDSLVSPQLEIGATSKLAFDLAYVSENTDGAYDGADLQVSVDGGVSWSTVDLTGGYPALSAGTTCVTEGSPFFSGVSPLMKRYEADLAPYAGRLAQFRFRFASDPLVDATPVGAWIDNVSASNVIVSVPSVPCP